MLVVEGSLTELVKSPLRGQVGLLTITGQTRVCTPPTTKKAWLMALCRLAIRGSGSFLWGATYGVHALWCNLCCADRGVLSTCCNLWRASYAVHYAVQSRGCNLRGAIIFGNGKRNGRHPT